MTGNRKTILYGLGSCDTCRKARRALESAGRPVEFRDVRDAPLSNEERRRFLAAFGDRLVNRASTTWRELSDEARQESPERLLAAHPALMKRPVVADGDDLWLGWDAATQAAVLK
ncbi:MAG TPA: ArsC/Spx/MgsR family protein [Albidovulum sp.]|uniref:arsenate reductase family protein n=1 Tax=Albidovulum sp. TaxID=1872424 RepID=UPI002BC6174B|nr:ArsC/Spx/MgsR family protein [Albidovulum sp.]